MKNTKSTMKYVVFACLVLTSTQLRSCDTPLWNAGDYWVWEITEPGFGKSMKAALSEELETNLFMSVVKGRETIEGEECYYTLETYDGHPESEHHSYYLVSCPPTEFHGIEYNTATGTPVMKSTIYPAGNYIMQFPLYLGKTWEGECTYISWTYSADADKWEQFEEIAAQVEAEVTSIESVEVEAGIFETYRVEAMNYTYSVLKSAVWYSPEVKNTVKGEIYIYEDKIPHLYLEFELTEYYLVTSYPWGTVGLAAGVIGGAVIALAYVLQTRNKKNVC